MKGSSDSSLIKIGEDAAEVVVELADETVIRRRLSSAGKQSVTVSKGDFVTKSPQDMLNGMFSASSFNPIALLDPKSRHDAIMSSIDVKLSPDELAERLGMDRVNLPPLDYEQHGLKVVDQAYRYFYQRRAEANKAAADMKKRWETYSADFKEPEVPMTTRTELQKLRREAELELFTSKEELAQTHASNQRLVDQQNQIEKYKREVMKIEDSLKDLKIKFEKEQAVLLERLSAGRHTIEFAESQKETFLKPDSLLEHIETVQNALHKIEVAEKTVDAFEASEKQRTMIEQMELDSLKAEKVALELTAHVNELNRPIKSELMAKSEMPIAGLEYIDGEFLVDGVKVDNLSSSRAMVMAIQIARKLAKKTKIICIDGAEALDEESFRALHKEIKGDGFTYFVTRVGHAFSTDDNVITMEKGQVKQ